MSVRWTFLRNAAIALVALVALYALFGWLAVPRIVQSQAERYVAEKTGYRLKLDLPKFNPFTLVLDLSDLRLDEPDGKPLLSFRNLEADFSVSGFARPVLLLRSASLDGPQAHVVLKKGGKSNWSEFIGKIGGKGESSSTTRLEIGRFRLSGGSVDFRDESNGYATRVEALELDLDNLSTWQARDGSFRLAARTEFGTAIKWSGGVGLSPLNISGRLDIANLGSKPFSAYLKDMPASFEKASLSAELKLAGIGEKLNLDDLSLKVSGIRVKPGIGIETMEAGKGSFDLSTEKLSIGFVDISGGSMDRKFLKIGKARIEGIEAEIPARRISVDRIALEQGNIDLLRNEKGRFEFPEFPKSSGGKPSKPWHYAAKKIELSGFSADFHDLSPSASLELKRISASLDGFSDDLKKPLPVRLFLESGAGGKIEAEGRVVPAEESADLNLKVDNLALKPAQPYLASFAKLNIADGKADADGHAAYGPKGASYRGKFAVKDLRLIERDTNQVFLSWKSLSSPDLDLTQSKLGMETLDIDSPYAKLIIARDRSVNISDILEKRKSSSNPSAFQVNMDRVRVRNGEMDYADYSLALPFGARIHKLHGFVNGISNAPGASGQLQLSGRVNEYGSVRAAGQIDLSDPKNLTDIKVNFANIEMARLTPYSATFAGRKIDSGKLTLNLDYRIRNHKLEGDNRVIMDNLKLGERVKSPQARDLPLDLAIAVLEDSDGRIDLGLPVSGSLDDPKFSYGAIIWKAIANIFEKIVTAPFRMLGALFGGGEKFENIVFDAGRVDLAPPEQEKLSRLANALEKRPGLFLAVRGVYADSDKAALQDLQARREVDIASGQHIGRHEDPGPLARNSPAIRSAMEKLFSGRFGKAELSALKEGFRKANPGKMKEGMAEKIGSRISGFFGKKVTLSEQEVENLKGADFYAVLFGRLRDGETVTDSQLQELGQARGELILSSLEASGVAPNRLKLESPVKVQGKGEGVPLRLELGAG